MRCVPGSVPGAGACDKMESALGSNREGATIAAITATHGICYMGGSATILKYAHIHQTSWQAVMSCITNVEDHGC